MPVFEPQFPKVTIPSTQQFQNSVTREPKLADRIKPKPNKSLKTTGKEANYLNFGFKTPTNVKKAPVQKQKNKVNGSPLHFEEPYKFQDPFVNAFPQLQQAFNIHSNPRGHASTEEFGSKGGYITNNLQNYNSFPQNEISLSHVQSEQSFDPYAHITHHPHGLVHVNLGNNIDGQIKQIEINNNGEFQAHLENDFDNDNEDEDDESEEDGGMGGEEEGEDGDDGFDELLKDDNENNLPYTGVMGHGRALTSLYPKGPMLFSHEHYDVPPKYPLQQHQMQPVQHLQQIQQNHLVTPTPTPAALQPLQPLYHRQFVPIQHLQPPSQEEKNQFLPLHQHQVQPIDYNNFKK